MSFGGTRFSMSRTCRMRVWLDSFQKGSGEPNKKKVGKVTAAQVRKVAEIKMPDLNANDIDAAVAIIEGTARSMGITVTD